MVWIEETWDWESELERMDPETQPELREIAEAVDAYHDKASKDMQVGTEELHDAIEEAVSHLPDVNTLH